jgi:predicted transcriptional regulator YdeE
LDAIIALYINVALKKGERRMGSRLIDFEIRPFSKARVIGKSTIVELDYEGSDDPTIPDLWTEMEDNGSLDILLSLPDRITEALDTVGWMGEYNPDNQEFTYLAGVLVKHDTDVPDGFEYRDIVDCEMAISRIQETDDAEGGNIHGEASSHTSKAKTENGYEYDGSKGGFEMEYMSYERCRLPEKRGEKVILDFYSPSKKAV